MRMTMSVLRKDFVILESVDEIMQHIGMYMPNGLSPSP